MAVWWLFNFAVCCCVRLYAVVSNCFNVSYCFYYIRVIVKDDLIQAENKIKDEQQISLILTNEGWKSEDIMKNK